MTSTAATLDDFTMIPDLPDGASALPQVAATIGQQLDAERDALGNDLRLHPDQRSVLRAVAENKAVTALADVERHVEAEQATHETRWADMAHQHVIVPAESVGVASRSAVVLQAIMSAPDPATALADATWQPSPVVLRALLNAPPVGIFAGGLQDPETRRRMERVCMQQVAPASVARWDREAAALQQLLGRVVQAALRVR